MNYLFTADIHAHNFKQFSTRLDGGSNSRLRDCLSVFAQVERICSEQKIDRFFVLGDLFHARTALDVDVLVSTFQAVKKLSAVVPITILKGNHDSYAKFGSVHSLEPFKEICTVVDAPMLTRENGFTVLACPWMENTEQLLQSIQTPCDLLLLHQAIQEAAIGPYSMTGHGAISVKDLPLDKVSLVFAGDYHKRQFLSDNRVHYIGSPCQLNFGERDEQKALTLLNTESMQITSIPTDAPRFFVCDSVAEYEKKTELGVIRKDIDFVRIECSHTEAAAALVLAASSPTVQCSEIAESKEALTRSDRSILHSDVVLMEEYVKHRAPEYLNVQRLNALGYELLYGESA